MTSQAQRRKPRKRARSLPGRPTTTGGHVRRAGSVDSGTATADRTVLTESTPETQVLDTLQRKTGLDLEIPKTVVVRPKKTLDQLYMDTGSLDKLLPGSAWSKIATNLKSDFTTGLPPGKEALAELCTVYYKSGKEAQIKALPASTKTKQVPDVVKFLEKVMEANGQWDYIRDQDWFKREGYAIGIEVNYYLNRPGSGALPSFHKDTAGDNIFANLIFDNDDTIEGTEWFADTAEPSQPRKTWQQGLLPKTYQLDLSLARRKLSDTLGDAGKTGDVAGGTVGKHAYVSWVDDLVWHATPTAAQRLVYDWPAAVDSYLPLNRKVNGDFQFHDAKRDRWISGREVIATMAEEPGPHLKAWLARNKLKPQDIDDTQAKRAWKELYGGHTDQNMRRYFADTRARLKSPWRLVGYASEASAQEKSLAGSVSIKETPVGLSKRRRANSLPPSTELAKARAAKKPRNFLRTWIRVLPPTTTVPGIDLT